MFSVAQNFIPILTSQAGLCLTKQNWLEAKVTTVSCSLEHLFYKPGQDILNTITDLARYLAAPGCIILNAASLVTNRDGFCMLKSPYDGSKIKFTFFDLFKLIQQLNPAAVILPKNMLQNAVQFWTSWNHTIVPFFHIDDIEHQHMGQLYGVHIQGKADHLNWEYLDRWPGVPRYLTGDFDPDLIHVLRTKGVEFIETNNPVQAALYGKVYSRSETIDLTDLKTQMQFEKIDAQCLCPTCNQQLTRAYLHHLLQHTPLLCQRFLIQHNVFYAQSV